ncbi:hypothetical protein GA0116948_10798 [Chitinophaga costaii]|uniref:Anti-sigma factor n=2 Tax=Chitinophaga costaii TaxID=1335309 RepID=A0A1C4E5M7_9BACT|nr:hypothetical protein [Chitinophaga costaii]PUZ24313.1 hypothetical protein DCM91_12845 [Chitinophaga costaii]SCC38792.1 hypothetical protein GA0116948_10798 [Chitinophaga costaii]
MEENEFESFVRHHRHAFEEGGPDAKVWSALEKTFPAKPSGGIVRSMQHHWLKIAVVLVLLINVGVLIKMFVFDKPVASETVVNNNAVAPSAQDAQAYYASQIEQKLQAIRQFPQDQLGLDSAAQAELQLRNSTYEALQKELKANPGNERIHAALIQYYQLKVELLDRILDELQEKHPHTKNTIHYERTT